MCFCDKPMTATLQQAQALQSVIDNTQAYFVLTHNYSANALIRQARAMVKKRRFRHYSYSASRIYTRVASPTNRYTE